MAGLTYKIEDAVLRRRIRNLRKGVENPAPLLKEWGEIASEAIDYNFEQGGRPGKWKRLSPITVKLKTQRGASDPERVLFFKGLLRRGIAYKVEKNGVVIGTSPNTRAYAAIQQFGGKAGRKRKVKIPARPYMVIPPGDLDEMKSAAQKFYRALAS